MARILSSILCKKMQLFATPLVQYRTTRTPPWKWTTDDKIAYFFTLPAVIGGGFGCALGTYEGFRLTHKDTLPYNIVCTWGVFLLGGTIGAATAGLWPVTVPFSIARAYFPGDKQSVCDWTMFATKKRKTT